MARWSRARHSDRKGGAIFIGTPKGHNNFFALYQHAQSEPDWQAVLYRASQTGIVDAAELESARKTMTDAEYAQEYECSWQAAIRGAYYGNLIADAEDSGRISRVPYDNTVKVETWWDLVVGDSTVVIFAQRVGMETRVIDHYEMTGEGLPHYAKVLQEKGYIYSRHIAPHDIQVRELGSGKSRLEIARDLGINFDIAPKQSIEDGIQAVRAMLPKCWFDKDKTTRLVDALRQYRADYDDKLQVFRPRPLHDWTSHSADAMRYGAVTKPESEYTYAEDDEQLSIGWMA